MILLVQNYNRTRQWVGLKEMQYTVVSMGYLCRNFKFIERQKPTTGYCTLLRGYVLILMKNDNSVYNFKSSPMSVTFSIVIINHDIKIIYYDLCEHKTLGLQSYKNTTFYYYIDKNLIYDVVFYFF